MARKIRKVDVPWWLDNSPGVILYMLVSDDPSLRKSAVPLLVDYLTRARSNAAGLSPTGGLA